MDKIKGAITLFEDALKTPYKAFALGVIIGALVAHQYTKSLMIEEVSKAFYKGKESCQGDIINIKEFLKEIAK